jgi:hypothetical protein
VTDPEPQGTSLHEPIAHTAHDALRIWREADPKDPRPVTARLAGWHESPDDHRNALIGAIQMALAGHTPMRIHRHLVETGVLGPHTGLIGSQRKEAVLVHNTAIALGCGVERWPVKTGTDPEAAQVNMVPQQSTVAELIAFPAPPPDPPARVPGLEFQGYSIDVTVTSAKIEADSDYHLALADDAGNTMIGEAACPGCAAGSPWLPQIQAVRAAIDAAIPGISGSYQDVNRKVTIQGPGFFDRSHGQRGVAPNAVEIHPILDIVFH